MKIAIIDADLIGRKKHRFPNLVCLKLSGYYKENDNIVELKTDYNNLDNYDKIFISKVFTDTPIDENILQLPNVEYGGTGFFYDNSPPLPYEIEHHMPDYHLYDKWVNEQIKNGCKKSDFKYYTDYSIGFMTRGCFRGCEFCVNKNYKKASAHSPLDEFLDKSRKKICLLDDNFLACREWRKLLQELKDSKKTFQFKQGLDERLLTDEKCEMLFNSKYDGRYIFAFDNIADAELIETKLKLIRKYTNKRLQFYTFCGFDRNDKWDNDFWKQDIIDLFFRIELLMKYDALPYVMRFNRYIESPYRGIYVAIACWCNQPSIFHRMTFREFCNTRSDRQRYFELSKDIPELEKYYDMRFGEKNEIK